MGVSRPTFKEPLAMATLPTYKWLQTAYARDILGQLDGVKAKITSIYGSILKLDSTKKVPEC